MGDVRRRVLLALLLCTLSSGCGCGGHAALDGEQQLSARRGRLGLVVPLNMRHGVARARGRRLLRRSGVTPVHGAVREGYFYATLSLGSPARSFSTIIDTGSTMTYIPCASCKHCGHHTDAAFDPARSSTATVLSCSHKLCDCGTPACSCRQDRCYYSRHYAEMSSSEGWLVLDQLAFPDNGSSLPFVFGCEAAESGAIYSQAADGVLGMGNNNNALHRQLARSGLVDSVFSLCFGFPAGGTMLLGDVPLPRGLRLSYTPLVERHNHYFNVVLQGLSLAGRSLAVNKASYSVGYGAVLDSGTTFTYLPSPAFAQWVDLLTKALAGSGLTRSSGGDPQYQDICWRGAPRDWKDVGSVFPNGSISFAGEVSVVITPQRYLFAGRAPGEYCLGVFDNGWQGVLLGGILMRDVLVQYDVRNGRVGFADTDCNQLRSAASETAAAAAAVEAAAEAKAAAAAHAVPAAASPLPEPAAAGPAAGGGKEAGVPAQAAAGPAAAEQPQRTGQAHSAPVPPLLPQQQQQQQASASTQQAISTQVSDDDNAVQRPRAQQYQQQQQRQVPVHGSGHRSGSSSVGWWLGLLAVCVLLASSAQLVFALLSPRMPAVGRAGGDGPGPGRPGYMQVGGVDTELMPLAAANSGGGGGTRSDGGTRSGAA